MKSLATAGSRLLACAVALALAAPLSARAAEVTRVATSFEPQNPFDLDLGGYRWKAVSGADDASKIEPQHGWMGAIIACDWVKVW